MKIRIEIDENLEEDEVTIKCKEINQTIKKRKREKKKKKKNRN